MAKKEILAVSLDSGARIVDFNDVISNVSGYTKHELIGKNWFEVFIPESNMFEVLKVFNDLFYGRQMHWEYTNDIKCKNGTHKTIKWINNIIKNENNKPELIYSLGTVLSD